MMNLIFFVWMTWVSQIKKNDKNKQPEAKKVSTHPYVVSKNIPFSA